CDLAAHVSHWTGARQRKHLAAISVAEAEMELLGAARKIGCDVPAQGLQIFGKAKYHVFQLHHFGCSIPKHGGHPLICIHGSLPRIEQPNPFVGGLYNLVPALLCATKLPFCLTPRSDISKD